MLAPRKLKFEAKKREAENLRFRTFLKTHADAEKLDRQFATLHKELFAQYDCSRCRNCCKEYYGELAEEDFAKDAKQVGLTEEEFLQKYLVKTDNGYRTKNRPCNFLQKDGGCFLGECRPDHCKKYPFTDQPGRIHNLYGMLEEIEVCPVAFEIWEQLKAQYHF